MKRNVDRILTTHTGSLPRPTDLEEMIVAREQGDTDPSLQPSWIRPAAASVLCKRA